MKNKIIILGDSYTYGHGCSDRIYYFDDKNNQYVGRHFEYPEDSASEYCWGSLLSKRFPEFEVVNLSRPGNANIAMFGNLVEYGEGIGLDQVYTIIFVGTFVDRIEIATLKDPEQSGPWLINWDPPLIDQPEFYQKAKDYYRKFLYNGSIGINLSLASIFGAHSYATSRGIKFYWSIPLGSMPPQTFNVLKPIINMRFKHIHNYDYSGHKNEAINKSCLAPDLHVNEIGHALYFQKEIIPIINKITNDK